MIQIRPVEVTDRRCGFNTAVIFDVPSDSALSVEVADGDAALLRAAFLKREAGLSLFDLWSMGNSFPDGQMTEVDVEVREEVSFFSLVFVSDGLIWRTPIDPVDGILIGLRFGLPFFTVEPSEPGRLSLPTDPYDIRGARITRCETHAHSAGT